MTQPTPEEILLHAHTKEKTLEMRNRTTDPKDVRRSRNQNKIAFIVHPKATKHQIRKAVEKKFSVKVVQVNTVHGRYGKLAIVKIHPDFSAEEVGERISPF